MVEGCRYCERLGSKVKLKEVWLAEHEGHGGYSIEPFIHPSGLWYWIKCKCGHRYLTHDSGAK